MKIAVIGTGYVGLVSGVCFAHDGHEVTCVDNDANKIASLLKSIAPIYEPGLEQLLQECQRKGHLDFTTDLSQALDGADIAIIAVGTPTNPHTDKVDMSYVETVAAQIKQVVKKDIIVIMKSTVPVGTCSKLQQFFADASHHCQVISNPEFLREGHAIEDFMNPERIVIGSDRSVEDVTNLLYAQHIKRQIPILYSNYPTAELIKYASNVALSAKIALINEIATLCEKVGGNITELVHAVGMDSRIGNKFLNPGPGFGGSCFPKDTKALLQVANDSGFDATLLKAITISNHQQINQIVTNAKRLVAEQDKIIAILGVTYKANTDDVRSSPAIAIIDQLLSDGYKIKIYDPKGLEGAREIWQDQIDYCDTMEHAVEGASLALVLTEWEEFKQLNFDQLIKIMSSPTIYDTRNIVDFTAAPRSLSYYRLGHGEDWCEYE